MKWFLAYLAIVISGSILFAVVHCIENCHNTGPEKHGKLLPNPLTGDSAENARKEHCRHLAERMTS